MLPAAIVLIGILLAFANGANDNAKGVATLLGSGTAGYRGALAWAAVTTALGSLAALAAAGGLLASFSGKGLVPPEVTRDPAFPAAVALAAGLTVLPAARLGLPGSTTHVAGGARFGIGTVTRRARWGTISRILSAWVVTLPAAGLLGAGLGRAFLALG